MRSALAAAPRAARTLVVVRRRRVQTAARANCTWYNLIWSGDGQQSVRKKRQLLPVPSAPCGPAGPPLQRPSTMATGAASTLARAAPAGRSVHGQRVRFSSSAVRFLRSLGDSLPRMVMGSSTFSNADKLASRLNVWNTKPAVTIRHEASSVEQRLAGYGSLRQCGCSAYRSGGGAGRPKTCRWPSRRWCDRAFRSDRTTRDQWCREC